MNASFDIPWNRLDRRRFLRGTGWALALPHRILFWSKNRVGVGPSTPEAGLFLLPGWCALHLAPMIQPIKTGPGSLTGEGRDYALTGMKPLEGLREDFTILSGLSHPSRSQRAWPQQRRHVSDWSGDGARGTWTTRTRFPWINSMPRRWGIKPRHSLVLSTEGGTGRHGGHTPCPSIVRGEPFPRRIAPSASLTGSLSRTVRRRPSNWPTARVLWMSCWKTPGSSGQGSHQVTGPI